MKRGLFLAFPLALTACCPEPITVGAPPPPAEYLVCANSPAAPSLAPLEPFAMPNGVLAYPKAETDARDGYIARYIVALRAAYGDCTSQLERVKDYVEG